VSTAPAKLKEVCQYLEEMQVYVKYPANHAEMGEVRPDLQDDDLYVLMSSQYEGANHDNLH